MVRFEVGVEAGRAQADVDLAELAHGGEVVERLVDGAQRDHGEVSHHGGVHGLGGRVHRAAVEHAEDGLALPG
ncbi:MAG: hypothetical protein R2746_17025 [Acidimicrobiales bacterium]